MIENAGKEERQGVVDKVQADVEYKDFWEKPEHFADLFNGVCFQGRKVIRAEAYNGGEKYKISPVITVVMYYGSTPWSGPLCLVDMMGDVSQEIRNVVSDYKMHLVEVLRSDAR